jgi:hypothetical protein
MAKSARCSNPVTPGRGRRERCGPACQVSGSSLVGRRRMCGRAADTSHRARAPCGAPPTDRASPLCRDVHEQIPPHGVVDSRKSIAVAQSSSGPEAVIADHQRRRLVGDVIDAQSQSEVFVEIDGSVQIEVAVRRDVSKGRPGERSRGAWHCARVARRHGRCLECARGDFRHE